MKKTLTGAIIMAAATLIMGVVLSLYIHNTGSVPAADGVKALTDGSYTASAQGCLGEVQVTVTVTDGKVAGVAIDASQETPSLGGVAAESLAETLTRTGSPVGVDAVAGATMTSDAIFAAMEDCLSQAR